MLPLMDDSTNLPDVDDTPVLLRICPTEEGSLDVVPIPFAVVGRSPQRSEPTLSPDQTLVPFIVPLVPEFSQTKRLDPYTSRVVKISIPSIRSPISTFITEIRFKRTIAIPASNACSGSGLLVIPLPVRPSDRPNAPGQPDKSASSSRFPRARWHGPDLVPSSPSMDRLETFDDETHSGEIASEIESDEDDFEYVDDDDNDESKHDDMTHSDMFVAEEK
jgi:hypothetical protein